MSVIDFLSYKESKHTYKKCKIILKDLKDLEKLLNSYLVQLTKFMKYKPVGSLVNDIKEQRKEIQTYILTCQKKIEEFERTQV